MWFWFFFQILNNTPPPDTYFYNLPIWPNFTKSGHTGAKKCAVNDPFEGQSSQTNEFITNLALAALMSHYST